jgi:hypothetical protein
MEFIKDSVEFINEIKDGFKGTDDKDGGLSIREKLIQTAKHPSSFVDSQPEPYTSSVNYMQLNFFKLDKILGMLNACLGLSQLSF